MKKSIFQIYTVILVLILSSQVSSASLKHYGVQKLTSSSIEATLKNRFKAKGKPLFLVHDVRQGLSQGDFIRFADKVVLIDSKVFQTLKAVGAFKNLKRSPVVGLKAKAKSSVWKSRAKMVKSNKQTYAFVGELLKVFESYFGDIPNREEMILSFDGSYLSVVIPKSISSKLRFQKVKKVEVGGDVQIISKPIQSLYVGEKIDWELWAVDSQEPSEKLQYLVDSLLPPGLMWNPESHKLEGQIDSVGDYTITTFAKNPRGNIDTLSFELKVKPNIAPEFITANKMQAVEGGVFSFTPLLRDKNEGFENLSWNLDSTSTGVTRLGDSLVWNEVAPDSNGGDSWISLSAWDKFKDTTRLTVHIEILKAESFVHKSGFVPEIVWDSLLVNRTYKHVFSKNLNAQILGVTNVDKKLEVTIDSLGDYFEYTPERVGLDTLFFVFDTENGEATFDFPIYVKEANKPVITSKLSSRSAVKGTRFVYSPTATDEDNDSLTWSINYMDPGFKWENNQLTHPSDAEGVFNAQIKVTDQYGQEDTQWVRWEVVHKEEKYSDLIFKNYRYNDGISHSHYDFLYESESGNRVGMFIPNAWLILPSEPMRTRLNPMLYFGANFLNGDKSKELLILEIGFTLHQRDTISALGAGGMIRLQGRYTMGNWMSNFMLHAYVRDFLPVALSDTQANREEVVANMEFESLYRIQDWVYVGPYFSRRDYLASTYMQELVGLSTLFQYDIYSQYVALRFQMGYGITQEDNPTYVRNMAIQRNPDLVFDPDDEVGIKGDAYNGLNWRFNFEYRFHL